MRDPLCSESYLLETIEFNREKIYNRKKEIIQLKDDMKKGIQGIQRSSPNFCVKFPLARIRVNYHH